MSVDPLEQEVSEAEPDRECRVCGYVLAGVGLVVGVLFLYMSFDVLSGGKLTTVLGLGGKREEVDVDGV